jgi:hypothetical protein
MASEVSTRSGMRGRRHRRGVNLQVCPGSSGLPQRRHASLQIPRRPTGLRYGAVREPALLLSTFSSHLSRPPAAGKRRKRRTPRGRPPRRGIGFLTCASNPRRPAIRSVDLNPHAQTTKPCSSATARRDVSLTWNKFHATGVLPCGSPTSPPHAISNRMGKRRTAPYSKLRPAPHRLLSPHSVPGRQTPLTSRQLVNQIAG